MCGKIERKTRMDERINKVAALANISAYNKEATNEYIEGAPHIKHYSIKKLYEKLVIQAFGNAKRHTEKPTVLDLGAGEGSVSLSFIKLGASVVAVDISNSQLDALKTKCKNFDQLLETRCEDIKDTIEKNKQSYDIIVANSFLHHVPDYLGLIKKATKVLNSNGQIISFQDPMRYDQVSRITMVFSKLAYFCWRIFRGDVIGGIRRRVRRSRGIFLENSEKDNAEYHVIRNGVDHGAICKLLEQLEFDCRIITYFSTQSRFFQYLGGLFQMKNTFGIVAQKRK